MKWTQTFLKEVITMHGPKKKKPNNKIKQTPPFRSAHIPMRKE